MKVYRNLKKLLEARKEPPEGTRLRHKERSYRSIIYVVKRQ